MKTNIQPTTTTTNEISLKDITPSPFNYRKIKQDISEESLQELAESIKKHEVLQAVLVRPLDNGKYELVVGERRFRASKLAGKKSIPATIKILTNEQVQEIQLIENLQRENPHPMAEALAIGKLLALTTVKNSVEEIAHRIGKSLTYVYTRKKLNELIESLQEMYFADVINSGQALKLSALDSDAQNDFFNAHCSQWQEEGFELYNFNNRISNYQLDLSEAPFNVKDAKLDKKVGACTKCPNNTAVATSLFPEESDEARCTNRNCYENKCRLYARFNIALTLKENPGLPIAVPDDSVLAIYFSADDAMIKGRSILMEDVDYHHARNLPSKPDREDYTDYEDEEENEQEFTEAVEEYETDMQQIRDEVEAGKYQLGILISEFDFGQVVRLIPINGESDAPISSSGFGKEHKAKDYQEAIKSKTLNIEVIQGERQRLEARERRSKELDQIKLQESFYAAFKESEAVQEVNHPRGRFDRAVAIFLIYDNLSWSAKQKMEDMLYDEKNPIMNEDEQFMYFFLNATDHQVSFITRIAMLDKDQGKLPDNNCGRFLRLLVEGTVGMDATKLVNDQASITKEREAKLDEKLAVLDKQATKLAA